ncbi:hypothetical protein EYF80_005766 [Liparis tanakae]|uniref:Uncharacterized protein n=1 Tax=Liparis tanakae TaxID=230148 RepID=A0A4Z2J0N6_9TELE|nr:hypothetical protein EYF80_005766 [Liparis tanakae]
MPTLTRSHWNRCRCGRRCPASLTTSARMEAVTARLSCTAATGNRSSSFCPATPRCGGAHLGLLVYEADGLGLHLEDHLLGPDTPLGWCVSGVSVECQWLSAGVEIQPRGVPTGKSSGPRQGDWVLPHGANGSPPAGREATEDPCHCLHSLASAKRAVRADGGARCWFKCRLPAAWPVKKPPFLLMSLETEAPSRSRPELKHLWGIEAEGRGGQEGFLEGPGGLRCLHWHKTKEQGFLGKSWK